ncbi:MAG: DUF2961 domain-containing protein [Armatimonadetes bacterium]|nr:DUF2961 domain-containing protein [Armatimonadota bacterium]
MGWRALLVMMGCAANGWAQDPPWIEWSLRPELAGGTAHLASSADPTGGNNDRGNYLRREGGRVVLMDADGPGVITRIWSANPAGTLRVFFDGEDKPRLELPFDQLGTPGSHWPRVPGYCSVAGGGVSCTWRMPFVKHARVEAEGVDQLYYQVNYTTLPSATGLTTFEARSVDPLQLRSSVPVGSVETVQGDASVPPGGRATLRELSGAGSIRRLSIKPSPDTLAVLRALRVQLTWDGASGPSVDVPLGDLAVAGLGRVRSAGLLASYGPDGYTLRPSMPYRTRATVALVNAGQSQVSVHFALLPGEASGEGYFCATGHASTTESGKPHTLLDVTGAGKYVGTAVTLVGQDDLKFLEGDETFVVDGGEKLQGTGTEDYFDGAWFFRRGPFADPFAGAPTLLAGKTRVAAYRWHLNDAIPFAKRLQATLEHGAHNDAPDCRYRSVAYWYSATPYVSAPMPIAEPLPPFTEKADDRRIVEAHRRGRDAARPSPEARGRRCGRDRRRGPALPGQRRQGAQLHAARRRAAAADAAHSQHRPVGSRPARRQRRGPDPQTGRRRLGDRRSIRRQPGLPPRGQGPVGSDLLGRCA